MKDEELVARIRQRDPSALTCLIETYASSVYRLVHRVLGALGSVEDVEESTSDVFQVAWLKVEQFDPSRGPLRTWLLMLAKYQALLRRRHLARATTVQTMESVTELVSDPHQELATVEEREAVQTAINELAPLDRTIVYQRYFIGETVDVIARNLGLTRQAVDNRLWRARKSLRRVLDAHGTEEAVARGK